MTAAELRILERADKRSCDAPIVTSDQKQDRLYVNAAGGAQMGWRDLRTGQHSAAYPHPPAGSPTHAEACSDAYPCRSDRPVGSARPAGRSGIDRAAGRLRIQNPFLSWLARELGVRGRDLPWRLGAVGEVAAGSTALRQRGCYVLYSIDLGGGGEVDHLVIGRYGVFSINTKHHRRAVITVNRSAIVVRRRSRPYPQASRREAERVRAALSAALGRPIHVSPLVVVHGHARLHGWIRHQPLGVQVLPSWAVAWWFRLPDRAILTQPDIDLLYAAARRPDVWRTV